MPNLPRSPRAPTKKPFGPARVIAGSHPAVMEPSQPTPEPLVQAPPVMPVVDILIPSPNNPCYACHKLNWPCTTWLDKRTRAPCMLCIHCTTKKIKCTPANMGSPPPRVWATSDKQCAQEATQQSGINHIAGIEAAMEVEQATQVTGKVKPVRPRARPVKKRQMGNVPAVILPQRVCLCLQLRLRVNVKTGAQGGRDLKGLASAHALCPLPEYVPLISE
ncbi:hypothetical protein BDR03DRAFT_1018588 [Suillus americanus]|nr:hypothetical protein BDR03DRAFT_1018588 [Suillus americanus]